MSDENTIVIVRPDWTDVACKYGYYWFGVVKDDALNLGLTVIDLEKELARKVPLNEALDTHDPLVFTGVGHGNPDMFTGQHREELMRICQTEKLAGRHSYILSCSLAKGLGYDIITKGGILFLGYWTVYTWMISTGGKDIPGDKYDKAFYDVSNAIIMLLNRNAYSDFAKQAAMQIARLWVAWWERSPDPVASSVIKWMINNYLDEELDPLRHYGTPSRKYDVDSHVPVVQAIRPTVVGPNEDMPIEALLTCPSGCDLTGQGVKVYDGGGALKDIIPLTHFANGVNYSDTHNISAPAIQGRHIWKVVYDGDGQHAAQEAVWTIVVSIQATIAGVVTDSVSGVPIEGVHIHIDYPKYSVFTDVLGRYSKDIELVPGRIRINAFGTGFYSQRTFYIDVTEPKVYTVNFSMSPALWRDLTLVSVPVPVTFMLDRKEASVGSYKVINGYHLIEAPAEIVSGGKAYKFLHWEDGTTDPRRLIYMSATKALIAEYEEVGMAAIHGESEVIWTFVIEEEEHDTIIKMVEKFDRAAPAKTKHVRVGVICAVEGQACSLAGKMCRILDHNGVIAGEGVIQAWDEVHQCYATGLIPILTPAVVGPYAWKGRYPQQ